MRYLILEIACIPKFALVPVLPGHEHFYALASYEG